MRDICIKGKHSLELTISLICSCDCECCEVKKKKILENKKMKLFLVLSAVLSIALSHPYKSSGGHGGQNDAIGKARNESVITKELNFKYLCHLTTY